MNKSESLFIKAGVFSLTVAAALLAVWLPFASRSGLIGRTVRR